jgi:hypothetical protein
MLLVWVKRKILPYCIKDKSKRPVEPKFRSSTNTCTTCWACYDRGDTLHTSVHSTNVNTLTRLTGQTAVLIHVVMDPAEAVKIGPGACSRETKSASMEPPKQISAAHSSQYRCDSTDLKKETRLNLVARLVADSIC